MCARVWLQAFQCATAAELPDPELLHTTASSAGKQTLLALALALAPPQSPACSGKLLYGLGRADEARAVGARATALGGLLHPMQAHAHKSVLQLHV